MRDQIDPDTDEPLWNWGVYNDPDHEYREWVTGDTIHNAMYIMKANTTINSDMYSYCQSQLNNDRLKFLIDENTAKNRLMQLEKGKKMTLLQRQEYLRPYVETSILKAQLANMVQQTEGANVVLKRANTKIKKDKVSALCYGLYWTMLRERRNSSNRKRDMSRMAFFTQA